MLLLSRKTLFLISFWLSQQEDLKCPGISSGIVFYFHTHNRIFRQGEIIQSIFGIESFFAFCSPRWRKHYKYPTFIVSLFVGNTSDSVAWNKSSTQSLRPIVKCKGRRSGIMSRKTLLSDFISFFSLSMFFNSIEFQFETPAVANILVEYERKLFAMLFLAWIWQSSSFFTVNYWFIWWYLICYIARHRNHCFHHKERYWRSRFNPRSQTLWIFCKFYK